MCRGDVKQVQAASGGLRRVSLEKSLARANTCSRSGDTVINRCASTSSRRCPRIAWRSSLVVAARPTNISNPFGTSNWWSGVCALACVSGRQHGSGCGGGDEPVTPVSTHCSMTVSPPIEKAVNDDRNRSVNV